MKPATRLIPAAVLAAATCAGSARAGLGDWLGTLKDSMQDSDTEPVAGESLDLSQGDMTTALKQALDKGTGYAIEQLGQPGGFLDNARVRIPMPSQLSWVESTLRRLNQDALADEFITSMNRAAERAVPEVAGVFTDAIRDMSLEDAGNILRGPDNAATEYFRTHSSEALSERILPIVRDATGATGVTSHYKSMMGAAGGVSGLLGVQAVDLDEYVTGKTLDGLFLMIAEQEKQIRENPLQRSTELMQKVFGSLGGR